MKTTAPSARKPTVAARLALYALMLSLVLWLGDAPVQASAGTVYRADTLAEFSLPGSARPLVELLRGDGTLDLASGLQGSLDPTGYRLASGPGEAPHLESIGATYRDARWSHQVEPPGMNNMIYALAVDGSGNLYAGGWFTTAGGVRVNHVARWNGFSWSALGSGLNSTVFALAVDGSGNLYAGGQFRPHGPANAKVSATFVARWDGSTWSPLSSGTNGTVFALAVDGSGNLYAGGRFTTAGGVSANNVAMWNGSSWSALGSGVDDEVHALAVDGSGNLYAGGAFTTAGGVSARHVAMWDGSSWSALGSGMGNPISDLAVDGSGNLYAGGLHNAPGLGPANYLAMWDGSSWSPLGSGMNLHSGGMGDAVWALASDGSGNLYVGGRFTTAGGVSTNNVAMWNGSSWSALGSGMDSSVFALAADDSGNLYAGGGFTPGGGSDTRDRSCNVAMWNGSTWSVLQRGTGVKTTAASPDHRRGERWASPTSCHTPARSP